ncbi:hypothetical protein NA57DRAFT_72419 [Rhizodiscina lignyota]|uniref:Uncharacterized protein n=1 Tax=Rhizodiscina lignyota TaxID=1504668 RepID=A0A9P4IP15_9PEZI|nr:hypothetical protein NA57DRAFT_72419 [Rhizodiscina lignyota]
MAPEDISSHHSDNQVGTNADPHASAVPTYSDPSQTGNAPKRAQSAPAPTDNSATNFPEPIVFDPTLTLQASTFTQEQVSEGSKQNEPTQKDWDFATTLKLWKTLQCLLRGEKVESIDGIDTTQNPSAENIAEDAEKWTRHFPIQMIALAKLWLEDELYLIMMKSAICELKETTSLEKRNKIRLEECLIHMRFRIVGIWSVQDRYILLLFNHAPITTVHHVQNLISGVRSLCQRLKGFPEWRII